MALVTCFVAISHGIVIIGEIFLFLCHPSFRARSGPARIPGTSCNEVRKSLYLLVLEYHDPVVGDEQDPVIRDGFFTGGCLDAQVIGFQAYCGAWCHRPVIGCAAVGIPYPDMPDIIAAIVPVLLEEPVAGQHGYYYH
jgi:hypothetical protein